MAFQGMTFSFQIEDQSLGEFDLSATFDPFDFNPYMLCPWAMLFFQKLCPAPICHVSWSFCEPHPGPQCCFYNLLAGQPENSWPLGQKYCIISNSSRYSGLHLSCFLQHVCQQHVSVNQLGWVTGTQCLLEVHLLAASFQGQLDSQGQCLPLWELVCCLLQFVLKPLTNSYNLDPAHSVGNIIPPSPL